jgi:hypothetical protein
VKWAAKQAIREDTYFPKVSRLLELGQKWVLHDRQNSADVVGAIADPWLCRACGQRASHRERWRPMNPQGAGGNDFRFWLTSADGTYLLLESHSDRPVCACHQSIWVPDPRLTFAAVPVQTVAYHMPFRRSEVVVELAA